MDITKLIFDICAESPDGVSQQDIQPRAAAAGATPQEVLEALNQNIKMRTLQVLRLPSGGLVFKSVSADERNKFRGLTEEEILVYQKIKESGDKGLWTIDLKKQTKLMQTQVTKALRTLEARELIKAVKTIAARNRKVYMIMEMEPSREITGGVFYTDQELDEELIATLYSLCFNFVLQKGFTSRDDVHRMVKENEVVKTDLRPEDVETILGILCYDGKLEKFKDPRQAGNFATNNTFLYRATSTTLPQSSLALTTCAQCPQRGNCLTRTEHFYNGDPIGSPTINSSTPFGRCTLIPDNSFVFPVNNSQVPSPQTCLYLKYWEKGIPFETEDNEEEVVE